MTVPCVCLVVLDGWGLAPEGPGNAVALADTPVTGRPAGACRSPAASRSKSAISPWTSSSFVGSLPSTSASAAVSRSALISTQ